ncbi:hypothetical protein B0H10DRAFT_2021046 [Mycena sp. CBHHK59/15]|nr:hypothetical protein B0H10DRAFT_2021046 [Mycena sp. CBHHK59/15]
MCDRKRPCSRCSRLGLIGNCVYEVDYPKRSHEQPDEGARLVNRIAELEGVIHRLKNNPNPRWLMQQDERNTRGPNATIPSPGSSSGGSDVSAWPSPTPITYGSSSLERGGGSFAPATSDHYPAGPGPPGPSNTDTLFALLSDHMSIRKESHCGCLNESACYNVVLDLSLRLRKAADVLSRFPSHSTNSGCALNAQISDLDAFTKNLLFGVWNHPPSTPRMTPGSAASSSIGQPYTDNRNFRWGLDVIPERNDHFLS